MLIRLILIFDALLLLLLQTHIIHGRLAIWSLFSSECNLCADFSICCRRLCMDRIFLLFLTAHLFFLKEQVRLLLLDAKTVFVEGEHQVTFVPSYNLNLLRLKGKMVFVHHSLE